MYVGFLDNRENAALPENLLKSVLSSLLNRRHCAEMA